MLVDVRSMPPADRGPGVEPPGALIGRKQELARVLRAWDDVIGGRGRIVFLAGEPGIGKTRLAREVMARAVEHSATVLVGRSFEQQASIPFFPFTAALADALAKGPPELKEGAFQRWPELAYVLPDLAPAATGSITAADTQQTQLQV